VNATRRRVPRLASAPIADLIGFVITLWQESQPGDSLPENQQPYGYAEGARAPQ